MSHCGKMMHEFPPGSKEAREHGCRCPILDNELGAGYMGVKGTYVTTSLCKLHWNAKPPPPPVHSCAGCGGTGVDVEDVSLVMGSGAEAPRRLIWEHSLCKLCCETLLWRAMSMLCTTDCSEKHGEP